MEDDPEPFVPEVFSPVTLAPDEALAEMAYGAQLIGDAMRLARWCGAAPGTGPGGRGRQVTAKGVLRPAVAREAVEELGLWQRDAELADPAARSKALAAMRSAGDLGVLDDPWQFAVQHGYIVVHSGHALPGEMLPARDDPGQVLESWRDALETEAHALEAAGTGLMPGMFGMMLENRFGSLISPLLMLLYGRPDGEWADARDVVSELGADRGDILTVYVVESLARLVRILERFGAAEASRDGERWRADHAALTVVIGGTSIDTPGFRARLTPLGRYGIRNFLAGQGHVVPVVGELLSADAATLLDALTGYDPDSYRAELTGWFSGFTAREDAVRAVLAAVPGADASFAVRRFAAVTALTMAGPSGPCLEILRETAANGPDGQRHVAAAVLANIGQPPPSYAQTVQPWLVIDTLSVITAVLPDDGLPPDMIAALRGSADDLWRCDHPATAATLEAAGEAVREVDKALAKRLRRSAHKARARS